MEARLATAMPSTDQPHPDVEMITFAVQSPAASVAVEENILHEADQKLQTRAS